MEKKSFPHGNSPEERMQSFIDLGITQLFKDLRPEQRVAKLQSAGLRNVLNATLSIYEGEVARQRGEGTVQDRIKANRENIEKMIKSRFGVEDPSAIIEAGLNEFDPKR